MGYLGLISYFGSVSKLNLRNVKKVKEWKLLPEKKAMKIPSDTEAVNMSIYLSEKEIEDHYRIKALEE